MLRSMLCLAAVLFAGAAGADERVGGVSRVTGECHGVLQGRTEPLSLASAVFLQQTVGTKAAARLEITFNDTTRLTLGENAELTIDRFVYNPKRTSRISLAVTGAMRFVGSAHKQQGDEELVTTPVVDIGARGTDFWAGPIDGKYGVLLFQGSVTVSNSVGRVVLDRPGEGVNIAGRNVAPGPVTQWPSAKVRRALAAVSFP